MNFKQLNDLREKIAQRLTEIAPLEVLMLTFKYEQLKWIEELDEGELLEAERNHCA